MSLEECHRWVPLAPVKLTSCSYTVMINANSIPASFWNFGLGQGNHMENGAYLRKTQVYHPRHILQQLGGETFRFVDRKHNCLKLL